MSNSKQPFLYISLFLILGSLIFFTLSFSNKNKKISTEIESIKSGSLYDKSIKYSSLSPEVFTTVQLEDDNGNILMAKVLEGSIDNGNLVGPVSLETDTGEIIEANVINIGVDSILEDVDGNKLIAKLGQQWILPNYFSQESLDYLSSELSQEVTLTPEQIEDLSSQLNLSPQTTTDILTGSQILTKLGDNWLLIDDLSGEVTTYISSEISTAINNIVLPDTSLTNGSVLEAHLANGSVSGSKIQNGVITVAHLASNSVSSAQIIDGNVSLAKLASNSVDSNKLVNGSIINEDISNTANIDLDKISKVGANLTDINNRNAEYITIADAGGYFTGSDVEAVLQEIANGTTLDSRYLQSYTETDPFYVVSVASNITNTDITNWDTAYGWGNHATQGYLTSVPEADCPTGMLPVPATNGLNGFCIDKYEAKQSGNIAVSTATGSPWVSINQYDAREACIGAGKHLITGEEWLQIAQNVEQVGWNWNGGVVGTNFMSDGHSDNVPANSLIASVDTDPCSGTGQTCDLTTWNSQRRTYKLSNGEYIWDIGGNVWEWTDASTVNDYPIQNNWAA